MKKWFSLASAILVCSFLIILLPASPKITSAYDLNDSTDKEITLDEVQKISEAQYDALMAANNIDCGLPSDSNGTPIYPKTYAGAYVDNDNMLVIQCTDDSEYDLYISLAGEYSHALKFEKAKYSFNELTDASESAFDNLYGVVPIEYYYVSEKDNNIIFGIGDGVTFENSSEKIIPLIKDIYDKYPIVFKYSDEITPLYSVLSGGNRIYNSDEGSYYSLGACGGYSSQLSFVTCGHLYQSVGDTIKYNSSSGDTIGTVLHRQYANNQYGDYEFVSISPAYFGTAAKINNNYTISGTISNPALNANIYYYGATSNNYSYGSVNARYVTIVTSSTTIKGITELSMSYGEPYAGDSGGPVFSLTNNMAKFCGVLHGKKTGYVYFTPYLYINSAGFTVNTSTN